MSSTAKILSVICVLVLASTIQKAIFINTLPIQSDELYSLARTCNFSIYPRAIDFSLNIEKSYRLDNLLRVFRPKFNNGDLFSDSIFFLKNFFRLSNHPPVADVLSKLTIFNREASILQLRYLSCFYFLITLLVLYLLYRELGSNKETSIWSLTIFSSLSLVSLTASFPKSYALQILVCAAALLFYLKALNQPKIINHLCSLALFHLAFFIHYFSVLILPAWYLLIDLQRPSSNKFRSVLYTLSLAIYYPIVALQREHTSDYFSEQYTFIREIKYFWKLILNLYGLNFKSGFAYVIIGFLIWYFIKSNDKKPILVYFALSLSPCLALLAYDQISHSHMIETLRYVLPALIFVALVLAQLSQNLYTKLIIASLLLLNILVPNIAEKKMLNAGIVQGHTQYIQEIASKSKSTKILILVPNYGVKNLIVLYELQAQVLGIKAITVTNNEMIRNHPELKNIFIASAKSMKDQAHLNSFIASKQIQEVYILPGKPDKNEANPYQELDLSKFRLIDMNINY